MHRIVTTGAQVMCAHNGIATPIRSSPRVTVNGEPVMTVTETPSYSMQCPAGSNACVSANWMLGAARVSSAGLPLAVHDGQSLCQPASRLQVKLCQTRAETR